MKINKIHNKNDIIKKKQRYQMGIVYLLENFGAEILSFS